MKIYNSLDEFQPIDNVVVTIGTFDGVHLGHLKLIKRVLELAKEINGKSMILTFFPHPRMILYPEEHGIELLNTVDEKISLLADTGIDHLIIHPFDQSFSELSSEEFINDVISNKLKTKKLIIGYDHRFGKNREGTFEDLLKLAPELGFEVEKIEEEDVNDIAVSSTLIRKALKSGDIDTAISYLGRPYTITGMVVHGDKIGRTIGFPTANLLVEEDYKLIPADGVYVVEALVGNETLTGMLSIGKRPTVLKNGGLRIEVFLLDFDKDIYGSNVTLKILKWIRGDKKFASMEELTKQIQEDLVYTLKYRKS